MTLSHSRGDIHAGVERPLDTSDEGCSPAPSACRPRLPSSPVERGAPEVAARRGHSRERQQCESPQSGHQPGDFASRPRPGCGGARRFRRRASRRARWSTEVGEANFNKSHVRCACALAELSRLSDGGDSRPFVWSRPDQFPGDFLLALLGRHDIEGAKRVALHMLQDEKTPSEALSAVQPFWSDPVPSDYSRKRRAPGERLRADPELRAAASRREVARTAPR